MFLRRRLSAKPQKDSMLYYAVKILQAMPMELCVREVLPDDLNNVHATRGQNVRLPCHTLPGHNVTWIQIEKINRPFFRMFYHGHVDDWLRYRINISDAQSGDFALNIYNIQVDDAGRYFCIEGFYEQPKTVLRDSNYPESLKTYDVYVEGKSLDWGDV